MTDKQLSEIMYGVCDSLNVPLTHEESELIMHYSKAIKRKLEAGQHETIVMRESDKAINWEVHDSEITGHVFEGNGVYIIKKFHQGDYKYMVSWRDDRKYEIIKLKESDHLLSLMKWCVEHWQLSDDVDA